ncbi:MAG: aminoacyl-tRNA hydrolase [Bacteroidota bacterium]|nr:aminoacyl-tRNA hydrolase [Bacteroidota bacterium]
MENSIRINDRIVIPLSEIQFRFSRSGGPGGQNVNRVSSRVELLFDLAVAMSLDADTKRLLLQNLKNKIDSKGMLRVVAQESRSQWKNRETAIEKFSELLKRASRKKKERKATVPGESSHQRRVDEKKKRSVVKALRRKRIDTESFS